MDSQGYYGNRASAATLSRRRALKLGLLSGVAMAMGLPSEPAIFAKETDLSRDISNPIAHLLRRAGFGASPSELARYESMGLDATIWELLNYETVPDDEAEDRAAALAGSLDMTKLDPIQRWWLVRMVYTKRPLQEKMTLFWHGLLTSGRTKVVDTQFLLDQNNFFRQNALGNFRDILKGISKDAAMLIWLDGRSNRKGKPNENYARELMELFTMGEGHYTEQDVRESARAFTGWNINKEKKVEYLPRAHDNGLKHFLGRSGNFGGDDIVDILVTQRATDEYLAKKLFSFFAYRNPSSETVSALADTYFNSGYSVKAMVQQILTSPEFYSPAAYRAIVKSPTEYVVGSIKALELDSDAQGLPGYMNRMGQGLFNPPNVAGWPGGAAWINSSTWLARINYANRLVSNRKDQSTSPLDFGRLISNHAYEGPWEVKDHYIKYLVDGDVSPGGMEAINLYLESSGPFNLEGPSLDRKGRALVYLLLASPEYQLS